MKIFKDYIPKWAENDQDENFGYRDDGKTVFVQCPYCGQILMRNFIGGYNYCPYCGESVMGDE